jgi:hypothetical protein
MCFDNAASTNGGLTPLVLVVLAYSLIYTRRRMVVTEYVCGYGNRQRNFAEENSHGCGGTYLCCLLSREHLEPFHQLGVVVIKDLFIPYQTKSHFYFGV